MELVSKYNNKKYKFNPCTFLIISFNKSCNKDMNKLIRKEMKVFEDFL